MPSVTVNSNHVICEGLAFYGETAEYALGFVAARSYWEQDGPEDCCPFEDGTEQAAEFNSGWDDYCIEEGV